MTGAPVSAFGREVFNGWRERSGRLHLETGGSILAEVAHRNTDFARYAESCRAIPGCLLRSRLGIDPEGTGGGAYAVYVLA